jgi:hypothetical protein
MEPLEESQEDLVNLVDTLPDRSDDGTWPVVDDYDLID